MFAMLATIILRLILFCLFVGLAALFLISFLNRRSSKTDTLMYDPEFNPSERLTTYETNEDLIEKDQNERSTDYYRLDLKAR